jgi:tryptophan synthase alpha chain
VTRIDSIFADLRTEGRTALMPFVTAGHPSLDVTARTIPALEEAGASIVEIGFPFSDPIADGPVIASSMHEALEAGTKPRDAFEMIRAVRPRTKLGMLAMVSHSIVSRMGPEKFIAAAADAGVDGLIIPDIDLEPARAVRDLAAARDLSFSLLVAPTTAPARMAAITATCTGFVYVLARVGITGVRTDAPEVAGRVAQLRAVTDLPLAVGFGIATAAHVEAVTAVADAAIVGSVLVRTMDEADDPVDAARRLVSDLAGGLATRAGATARDPD